MAEKRKIEKPKKDWLLEYKKRSSKKYPGRYEIVYLEGEIWKNVVGYEEYYMVSNKGRVISKGRTVFKSNGRNCKQRDRLLNTYSGDWYHGIVIAIDGLRLTKNVHRLVAEAFIPNPKNLPEVNHINGIKSDNKVENLEWCTDLENKRHAIKVGLKPKVCISKYTEEQIRRIRIMDGMGMSDREIGEIVGVNRRSVQTIRTGRQWSHIP